MTILDPGGPQNPFFVARMDSKLQIMGPCGPRKSICVAHLDLKMTILDPRGPQNPFFVACMRSKVQSVGPWPCALRSVIEILTAMCGQEAAYACTCT